MPNIKNPNLIDADRLRRSLQIRNTPRPSTPAALLQAVATLPADTLRSSAQTLAQQGYLSKTGKPFSASYIRFLIKKIGTKE